jgi:multicomponent Na+:H+ antiporter subunit F
MDAIINIIISIAIILISLGAILGIVRFIKGPQAADRTIALDTLSVIAIAVLVLLGYLYNRYIYIDLALVYAVLGFIGIIVVARFIEKAL